MAYPVPADAQRYTYAELLTWPEDERWELIDGVAYDMTPAPTQRHQEIAVALSAQFFNFLEGSPCRVLTAPFDVLLPAPSEDVMSASTVVQPDLIVVCEREKLDGKRCVGSPTLIVEILSPRTAKKDKGMKRQKYEQAGVLEYWVVYPSDAFVEVLSLDEHGRYGDPLVYEQNDQVPVGVLPGLLIDLRRVFAE